MKTFEQVYKEKFKGQLEKFIDKPLRVTNDLNYRPLEDDPNEVAVIIRTGPGIRSSIASYDLTSLTFYVDFIVAANSVQELLGALNNLTLYYNAVWDSVTIDIYNPGQDRNITTTFHFKPIFSTPFIQGNQFSLRTKQGTINAISVNMSVTVGYASNAAVLPETYKLRIDGRDYVINYDSRTVVDSPVYKQTDEGGKIIKQRLLSHVVTYTFVILRSAPGVDPLQDILVGNAYEQPANMLSGNTLKLIRGNKVIDIQTYNITERYLNGASVLELTLTR